MLLDLLFCATMLMALIKGFRKGLIVGFFSLVAFLIGIAVALKFSMVAASYLGNLVSIDPRWLPAIGFILVFLLVHLLVKLGAHLLEKSVELVFLGWVNKLGGVFFFSLLYLFLFSSLLFFAKGMHLFSENQIQESKVYSWVLPVGSFAVDTLGLLIPVFKNSFAELQQYFK